MKRGFVPVIEIEIAAAREADRERLDAALRELSSDEVRAFKADDGAHFTIAGVDERELYAKLEALRNVRDIDVVAQPVRIVYRETITQVATTDYSHKKQIGGSGEFARVKLRVEPSPSSDSYEFRTAVSGRPHMSGIEEGIGGGLSAGVVAGFRTIRLTVELIDCQHHDLDSSVTAFEIATRAALREALVNAGPILLEPVLKVEITTPREWTDAIVKDLLRRRGRLQERIARSVGVDAITAAVPAANMLGYAAALREISQDRASYVVNFDDYHAVATDPPQFPHAVGMRA